METNIVEVENFVQHTDERRGSAFTQEVKRYLEKYPDTQFIDVLLTDLNGCFRGKRIPVAGLSKLEKGCYFPASVFAMDILGNVVEEAGLGQELGEPDCICVPVPGTLTPPPPTRSTLVRCSSPWSMKMALPLTLSRGTYSTDSGSSCASAVCSPW
ncbi:Glutamate--putrescine ligase [Enterobacter cloacae]|uniref:Glutamate--putrescine ligase n=1 Tax=Enterobacter cloacae TaxID=550 RepID=A0A377M3V5_ENTCL|nr:Glutamate--putrescine ligase [Enterobacter cloacae]